MPRIIVKQMGLFFCCCVVFGGFLTDVMAQNISPATERTQLDSVLVMRRKMRNRATWEEIAYFPGRVLYFPLKYSLKGLGASIGYIDDTKLIPKIQDALTSDDGRRGVEPTYSGREGGGFRFYQKGLFDAPSDRNMLSFTVTAGEHQRQRIQLDLEEYRFARGLVSCHVLLRYRKLPTERFFGIGADAPFSDETNFTQEQTSVGVSLGMKLPSNARMSVRAGYEVTHIAGGREDELLSTRDQYTEAFLPGLEEQVDLIHLSVALTKDRKNRPGNPSRGYEAALSGGIYRQPGEDRFGFVKTTADFTGVLPIVYDRVLVFRIAGAATKPFDNWQIPFYYLSELGRKETIRGFERGRFRDRDMLLASMEYRYPIWRKRSESGVDFLLFADAGQVSPDLFREAAMDHFRTGFGFGFRLWDEEGLIAKFEVAKSVDQWRFYFTLN